MRPDFYFNKCLSGLSTVQNKSKTRSKITIPGTWYIITLARSEKHIQARYEFLRAPYVYYSIVKAKTSGDVALTKRILILLETLTTKKYSCLGVLGSQCYTRPRCWTVMY